ncbi:transglutaminase family protein [Streptomyces sp. NPDC048845]|uniref:transglutaminase-like domain-containing protein n=1 Tax=Streptomyces sp. NPDC048845 TaxID=3155390 RepID=UPI00343EF248
MLLTNAPDPAYLAADEVIDHEHPLVRQTAGRLRRGSADTAQAYAEAAYAFVRDTVPHSADTGNPLVTWRASDVLRERTGICYAKSHALVALLRAGGVPAGLCYQRLGVVHGLIALRLPGRDRWDRQDPRGNKPGIDARFSLDEERLAWRARPERGEADLRTVHATPPPEVLAALRGAADLDHLWRLLPADLPGSAELPGCA